MVTIHFYEDSAIVLSQLRKEIPSVEQEIKIKGKKGKILSVVQAKEDTYHVYVQLEKVKKTVFVDDKKKKRR
ncbi:MAG TPA: hypothetical protein VNR61_16865 [Niallia sp.]|nr:hypothetical protein [Niallia sp.]